MALAERGHPHRQDVGVDRRPGQPSKWATLRACAVFKAVYG